ncbi:MAG: hypothetical protein A3H27_00910 [Acidobacteria bacterium RIFCSPLOWO2_02_FULL_59_13]|nr:MAG: hypothetical protein A3H27_00910 [Acidobacteria bacterium RIFCSPLOWO2_02_FULL_59_13]
MLWYFMAPSRQPEISGNSEIPEPEKRLLAGAEQRINRGMCALGILGVLACWLLRDWKWGAGFAVGATLSAINFHWLKAAVSGIADVATNPGDRQRSARASRSIFRFVLRYALIVVAAYVIFKSSFISLGAFFIGLFVFLGAILIEVAYEIYLGLRHS